MDSSAWWQVHLEANLLRVQPTAMGQIPPSFDNAIRLHQRKWGIWLAEFYLKNLKNLPFLPNFSNNPHSFPLSTLS